MAINDDRFMRQTLSNQDAEQVFNQKKFNASDLSDIGNKGRWEAMKMVSQFIPRESTNEEDKYSTGTLVKFMAPDGTTYQGRVASKSGADYIVDVSHGESYLVPQNKLSKVTPESDKIREAMSRYVTPPIELVSKPAIEVANRCVARVAYKERKPSDSDLIKWAKEHYPDWRLVDAIDAKNRQVDLIFEIQAAEDVKPQGGQFAGGKPPLSAEPIEGTGVTAEDEMPGGLADDKSPDDFCPHALAEGIKVEMEHTDDPDMAEEIAMDHLTEDPGYYEKLRKIESSIVTFDDINVFTLEDVIPKTAQLGDPGDAERYDDLNRAARWVLARFNDSNPDYYAIPQEAEVAGEGNNCIVRLSFILQKNDDGELNQLYITRSGSIVLDDDPDNQLVRGFVQVDSEGNLPMIMLRTPIGPESVQEYGFNFSAEREVNKVADYGACAAAAEDVLSSHGGYSAEAQAEFDARLVKLGVDDQAKKYWSNYFKEYGKMFTRDIPRKKHKNKKTKKSASLDSKLRDYWVSYFGSGVHNDAWYGEALTRPIPRRKPGDKGLSPQESAPKKEAQKESQSSDYAAYIKEEGGEYCVKSEDNPDWSGGCYDTKEEAEERLQQVEYFKHKSIRACRYDGVDPNEQFVRQMAVVGTILDDLIHKRADAEAALGWDKRKKQPVGKGPFGGPELRDIVDVAQWSLEVADKDPAMYNAVYSLVYDFLRKYPHFLKEKVGETSLTPRAIGYTLVYALRDSPRTLKKFKKHINEYQRRWEKGRWKEVEQEAKDWRKQKKEKKAPSAPAHGEGPIEMGEQPSQAAPSQEVSDVPSQTAPSPQATPPPPPSESADELEVELEPNDVQVVEEQAPSTTPPALQKAQPSAQPQAQPSAQPQAQPPVKKKSPTKERLDTSQVPIPTSTLPSGFQMKYSRKADMRRPPAKNRTRFKVTRLYSTTSSADNGYIYMDVAWDPEVMSAMSDQNVQQQLISYVKGLESTKEFHDFGVMGKIRIIDFDRDAGVARVKTRCSETRGVPTLGYSGDIEEPISLSGIR